ncbi:MAG: carboxymuconolactone decarboxylase family protein [Rhodospirillales bacterium]|nr:4-carboxymuconolactone decarboxylase [Alphaproteobacteria bacterium HT1-32]
MDQARYDLGMKLRREVMGDAHVDRSLAAADEMTKPLVDLVTEIGWGATWGRPGLPKRDRSLINIGMLTALNRPDELRGHLRGALNNGVTREEIVEVILQTAIYCGMPAALDSMRHAKAVFAAADEEAAG